MYIILIRRFKGKVGLEITQIILSLKTLVLMPHRSWYERRFTLYDENTHKPLNEPQHESSNNVLCATSKGIGIRIALSEPLLVT